MVLMTVREYSEYVLREGCRAWLCYVTSALALSLSALSSWASSQLSASFHLSCHEAAMWAFHSDVALQRLLRNEAAGEGGGGGPCRAI